MAKIKKPAQYSIKDSDTYSGRMQHVLVTGGPVNVRSAPGMGNKIIGVVCTGDKLVYQDMTNTVDGVKWYLVIYNNENGWISGDFSELA